MIFAEMPEGIFDSAHAETEVPCGGAVGDGMQGAQSDHRQVDATRRHGGRGQAPA